MRNTIRRGLISSSLSGPSAQPSSAPGRKFSTSTSHSQASLRTISCACSFFKSSAMLRLLRDCTCHHTEVPSLIIRQWRNGSPPAGGSTLITSAPKSPNVFAANGPAMSWPSSSTFRPARGPGMASGFLLCRRRLVVGGKPLVKGFERVFLREQLVEVVHDLGFDAVLEHAEQDAQAGLQHEAVLRDLQFAVGARARERDDVTGVAFFV